MLEGGSRGELGGRERRGHGRRAITGGLDDDAPAVGRIRDPAHEAGLLEPVDQAGGRAGREAGDLADAPDGHRALDGEPAEDVDVGGGEAQALRDALAVGDAGGGEVGGGAEDGGDRVLAVFEIGS